MHAHVILFDKRFQHTVGFLSEKVTLKCPLLVQVRIGMKLHVVAPPVVRSPQNKLFYILVGLCSWKGVPQHARMDSWGCAHLFSLILLQGWTYPSPLCCKKWT